MVFNKLVGDILLGAEERGGGGGAMKYVNWIQ